MNGFAVYKKALELIHAKTEFALATVVKASGSTPQKAGAKAIFERSGAIWGTLGGGCLEAESRRRALSALDEGTCSLFDLSLDSDYGWDDGLICGGNVRVFVDIHPEDKRETFSQALTAFERHRCSGVIEMRLSDHERAAWHDQSSITKAFLLEALLDEKPIYIAASDGGVDAYIEPIIPAPRLLIAGGGHIGKATAQMGVFLDFDVTVIDDRSMFANENHIPPPAKTICSSIADYIRSASITDDTYIVIVTRGHRNDADVLAACIHSPAAYIGMIGSRRKLLLIRKLFVKDGLATEQKLDRIFSPIGLDIGAKSTHEIAASIAAQLVAVRRRHPCAVRNIAEAPRL